MNYLNIAIVALILAGLVAAVENFVSKQLAFMLALVMLLSILIVNRAGFSRLNSFIETVIPTSLE